MSSKNNVDTTPSFEEPKKKMDKGMWNYYQANYILENKMWEILSAKFSWRTMKKNGKWPPKEFVDRMYAMTDIIREEQHLNMMYFMNKMREGWEGDDK